jgi:hypothetical protein
MEFLNLFRRGALARFFLLLFVWTMPWQVNALVLAPSVFDGGFFNPYVSHFFYLGDLLFALMILFGAGKFLFSNFRLTSRMMKPGLLFLSLLFISLFLSVNWQNSLVYLFRYLEFFIVGLLLWKGYVAWRVVVGGFLLVMFSQSLLGVFQFFNGQSFGLEFLGEPLLQIGKLGVAKVDFSDAVYLRSYGTFSHPNVFAGYLVISLMLLFANWREFVFRFWRVLRWGLLLTFVLALVLTFSRSAWLALLFWAFLPLLSLRAGHFVLGFLLAFMLYFTGIFDLVFSRLLHVDLNSFVQRLDLLKISGAMFIDHPLGVGFGNFTEIAADYAQGLAPWDLQPVHNIFVLILVESGIFFFAFLAYISRKFLVGIISWPLLLPFLVIGLFDHYLLSLYQGMFLMVFALVSAKSD